jgi:hypothetical protein
MTLELVLTLAVLQPSCKAEAACRRLPAQRGSPNGGSWRICGGMSAADDAMGQSAIWRAF